MRREPKWITKKDQRPRPWGLYFIGAMIVLFLLCVALIVVLREIEVGGLQ